MYCKGLLSIVYFVDVGSNLIVILGYNDDDFDMFV